MRINNYYVSNNSNVLGANSKVLKRDNKDYSNDNTQPLSNLKPSLENTPIKMIMDNEKVKSSYFATKIQNIEEEEINSNDKVLNKWFGKLPPDVAVVCEKALVDRIHSRRFSNEDIQHAFETVSMYLNNSIEQYKRDNNIEELSAEDYTKVFQLCKKTINMELKTEGLTEEAYNKLCFYEGFFDLASELLKKDY